MSDAGTGSSVAAAARGLRARALAAINQKDAALALLQDMSGLDKASWREAARLYGLSAAQNFAHAQTNLGYMYEHGCAVEWNPCEAVRLYRLAAEQGLAVAQANLGAMYEKGCGVRQDLNEAVNWYRRAAAQGL